MKLLVSEAGSRNVEDVWLAAERRVASLLLYVEASAALGRLRRARSIDARELRAAKGRFERLWEAVDRLDVDESLVRRAGQLADAHGLRAYDSVHLASAEDLGDPEVVFVSADRRLLDAARELGLTTITP